jgi:enamine deaminase RidA (YjgF/YER057c/UK114 family)
MSDSQAPHYFNPATLAPPPGYTQVVRTAGGSTVYISGQVALDAKGNLVGRGDLRAQAQQVFTNLELALDATGGSLTNIVKLNTFLVDIGGLGVFREVRDSFIGLGPQTPASSLVGVATLAGPDYLIEVEAVAWLP